MAAVILIFSFNDEWADDRTRHIIHSKQYKHPFIAAQLLNITT